MKLYRIVLAAVLFLTLCIVPVSAADPVVGTWDVSGTTPFLFFDIPCADGTVTFNADKTGVMSGTAKLLFFDVYSADNTRFTWEKVGEFYQITLPYPAVVNVYYDAAGDKLTTKVNTGVFNAPVAIDVDGAATRAE